MRRNFEEVLFRAKSSAGTFKSSFNTRRKESVKIAYQFLVLLLFTVAFKIMKGISNRIYLILDLPTRTTQVEEFNRRFVFGLVTIDTETLSNGMRLPLRVYASGIYL